MKTLILISLAVWGLSGCNTLPKRDPDFAPVQPADLRPPPQSNGAIYQSGYDMRLFEDIKTRRVGDILTVTLNEATKAKKQADLNTSKDTSVSVTAPTLFGVASQALLGHDLKTSLAATSQFDGAGKADQSNSLTGDISVTVVEVLPNGNLKVRGEKRVALNDGDEYIRLSGIVRPIDITTANTVPSAKVADATIMYQGDGSMADSSKVGWLARFFLSPIFPF
ncbi:MAG: flagellar basal body L-ring protein FlgH [Gammaproteobacteria bacterium]